MAEKETYKYAPYLRGISEIDLAYKLGISVGTLNKLKAGSRPSFSTLKKFYDAGYNIIESFNY